MILTILAVCLASALAFILGAHLNYYRGYFDALDHIQDHTESDDIAEIRWQLTASGHAATEDALMENSHRRAS
jgi:hypothetical protein